MFTKKKLNVNSFDRMTIPLSISSPRVATRTYTGHRNEIFTKINYPLDAVLVDIQYFKLDKNTRVIKEVCVCTRHYYLHAFINPEIPREWLTEEQQRNLDHEIQTRVTFDYDYYHLTLKELVSELTGILDEFKSFMVFVSNEAADVFNEKIFQIKNKFVFENYLPTYEFDERFNAPCHINHCNCHPIIQTVPFRNSSGQTISSIVPTKCASDQVAMLKQSWNGLKFIDYGAV